MSLIRPEVRAALWRGREMWTGLAVAALSFWVVAASFGLLRWMALAALLIGAAFAVTGWQRMRLRPRDEGFGVVEVNEGRITYWGPLSGGTVARDGLRRITLDHGNRPATWDLRDAEANVLQIPVNAAGQDGLLDAFVTLPGLHNAALLTALEARDGHTHVLWTAPVPKRQ